MAYEITESTRVIENVVQEVIFQVFGGREAAAEKLGVTRQAIHYLLASAYIRDRKLAIRLSKMTGISAPELMALTTWQPETRGGPNRRTRRVPKDLSQQTGLASVPTAGRATEGVAQGTASTLQRKPKGRPSRACSPALVAQRVVGWR